MQAGDDSVHRSEPGGFDFLEFLLRPEQRPKLSPCAQGCAAGGDPRSWIGLVAQAEKLGLGHDESLAAGWRKLADLNPFPATFGRICPHPCELECSRSAKDGAVAINAMERFLGDWALERGLALPVLESEGQPEHLGVIGSGPAGLSFAYQMARRGYRVTIYESQSEPGGMLRHGIPPYRLPKSVLAAEIQRILDLGVELKLGTTVGVDVSLSELRERHAALFLGIGAQQGRRLEIPGEDRCGVWLGAELLGRINLGETPELGRRVVVVGGGNTAIDAARVARRLGAEVTLLYRRTREEMPAVQAEVDEALEEGVELELLASPIRIDGPNGSVGSVVVQRMRLGDPDTSGRRTPVAIPRSEYRIIADAVVVAAAQRTDWTGLESLKPGPGTSSSGALDDGIWAGGDAIGPGIAGRALSAGRRAAEDVHRQLRGLAPAHPTTPPSIGAEDVRLELYSPGERAASGRLPTREALAGLDVEVAATISEEAFFAEAGRCLSCGVCFGCERCWMYCNALGFSKLEEVEPGAYFSLALDRCEGCGKCIDVCPCGYLSARADG